MKKLLYLIPFLFLVNLHADTTTSGVGLLKVSSLTIDTTRNVMDKLNANWDIVGSSLNTLNTNINNNNTNLTTAINSSFTASMAAINSTNTAITSAYVSAINSTNTQVTNGYVSAINSTNTFLISAINSTQSAIVTMVNSTNSALNTRVTTLETDISTGFNTVGGSTFTTVNVSGYFLGDGSKITNLPLGGASTSSVVYNLVITTNTSLNQILVTADALDVMGDYYTSISTVADITLTKQGGLDTGTEAANTWYKLFAISNGSTISVIMSSANVLQPTLPSGFTKWRPIGYFFNNASSNIRGFRKNGRDVMLLGKYLNLVNSSSLAGTNSVLSLMNAVSPNAITACFMIATRESTTGSQTILFNPHGTAPSTNNYDATYPMNMIEMRHAINDQVSNEYCKELPADLTTAIDYSDYPGSDSVDLFLLELTRYKEIYP